MGDDFNQDVNQEGPGTSQPGEQPPAPEPGANPYPAPPMSAPMPPPPVPPPPQPGQGYQGYQGYPPPYPPPPGGSYGPYGTYAPPGGQGFSFETLLKRWQVVLMHPSAATFDAQLPAANWQTIWISLVCLAVVEAISDFITALEAGRFANVVMPNGIPVAVRINPINTAISGLIGAFVGFFVLSGILYISAKIFGGAGTFLAQSWLLSLFIVPLDIIVAFARIIPFVGSIVGLAALIYGLFLAVLAMASAHRITQGRAVAVVLLPILILTVLACVFALALATLVITVLKHLGY